MGLFIPEAEPHPQVSPHPALHELAAEILITQLTQAK